MPWNMSRIYPSFDSLEYKSDWELLSSLIDQARTWAESLSEQSDPLATMEQYIREGEKIREHASRLSMFSHLQLASNVQNEEARMHSERIQKKMELLTMVNVRFTRWIQTRDLTQIPDSSFMSPYRWDLEQIKKEALHLLPEREEDLLNKLKKTGSGAWSKLQQSITSLTMGEIQDENGSKKKLPLMSIRNLAFHENPQIRKNAYEVENKIYENLEEPAGAALNQIKGEMLTEMEWRGFADPWEKISDSHRISHETITRVMEAVKSKLPVLQSFYQTKARLLGHENGLPYWDLYAPLDKITKTYPFEVAKDFILTVFGTFDPVMQTMAEKAFKEDWIDIEPRLGKRGGAFCSGVYALKESRILLNHENTMENLVTMAHELGHAYHNIWMMKGSILHSGSPLSLAETASTFNEHLVQDYLEKELTGKELISFLEKKIQRSITVIVDIYSRYTFEQAVLDLRKQSTLSVRKLKELMTESEIEAYGPGLDPTFPQPNAWINKPHYYIPGLHFYNFPYTIGHLISTYLYNRYHKEGQSFLSLYQKLLGRCGWGNVEDILDSVGIDITSPEFINESFAIIEKDLAHFQELVHP
jgi:pepF/M3 family oligoendopeptidase